jgi:hypothetical protein
MYILKMSYGTPELSLGKYSCDAGQKIGFHSVSADDMDNQ